MTGRIPETRNQVSIGIPTGFGQNCKNDPSHFHMQIREVVNNISVSAVDDELCIPKLNTNKPQEAYNFLSRVYQKTQLPHQLKNSPGLIGFAGSSGDLKNSDIYQVPCTMKRTMGCLHPIAVASMSDRTLVIVDPIRFMTTDKITGTQNFMYSENPHTFNLTALDSKSLNLSNADTVETEEVPEESEAGAAGNPHRRGKEGTDGDPRSVGPTQRRSARPQNNNKVPETDLARAERKGKVGVGKLLGSAAIVTGVILKEYWGATGEDLEDAATGENPEKKEGAPPKKPLRGTAKFVEVATRGVVALAAEKLANKLAEGPTYSLANTVADVLEKNMPGMFPSKK